jgi:hypothetical protein
MKLNKKLFIGFAGVALALSLGFTGCKNGGGSTPPNTDPKTLVITSMDSLPELDTHFDDSSNNVDGVGSDAGWIAVIWDSEDWQTGNAVAGAIATMNGNTATFKLKKITSNTVTNTDWAGNGTWYITLYNTNNTTFVQNQLEEGGNSVQPAYMWVTNFNSAITTLKGSIFQANSWD